MTKKELEIKVERLEKEVKELKDLDKYRRRLDDKRAVWRYETLKMLPPQQTGESVGLCTQP